MMSFKEWREARKERKSLDRIKDLQYEARGVFQTKEHNKELWLTYDNKLVCPISMLKMDIVEALTFMREAYVQRNINSVYGKDIL